MQLRAMRIRKGKQQKELAKAIGTDEPMMSKFENYKCLPIPPMMTALCRELGCEVEDIYEPHEVYLSSPKATVKVANGKKKKKRLLSSYGQSSAGSEKVLQGRSPKMRIQRYYGLGQSLLREIESEVCSNTRRRKKLRSRRQAKERSLTTKG